MKERKAVFFAMGCMVLTLLACRERTIFMTLGTPLTPPIIDQEPEFTSDTLVLTWANPNAGIEGFQGYNVYLSTDITLVDLDGGSPRLDSFLVTPSPIGASDDTVVARFTSFADGTPLTDVDTFYAHIRTVINDVVGSADTQYVIASTGQTSYSPVENVQFEVIDEGDGIHLTWDAPADASPDEYVITVDGEELVPIEGTEEDVTIACAELAIYAVYDDVRSDPVTLDFSTVETVNVTMVSVNSPSASGFGFTADGTAESYSLSDDPESVDFYLSLGTSGTTPTLTAPTDHSPDPLNSEENAAAAETSSYAELDIAAETGMGNYSTQLELVSNGVYSLWLDEDSDGYSTTDYWAKMLVTDVLDYSGIYTVIVQVAFQPQAGLRWVVTE